MRWCVMLLLCVVFSGVRAAEVFLIPAENPKPSYPRSLYLAGVEGEVRISMVVHADGSVSQPSASKGAQPELAEAALDAIRQWRFQPWEVSSERPAQVDVVAPMVFRLGDTSLHANETIKRVRCSDLSHAAKNYADFSWVELPFFHWTRSYLTHSLSPMQLPNARRLALIAKLNRDAPTIIRRCNSHPSSRAVRFFPREVRELL